MITTYRPDVAPLGPLWLSALVALLPLVTVFVTLGGLRWKAHRAGLAALLVAILVAVLGYRMPIGSALLSASEGAVFGLFPIVWIVFTAIVLYQITVVSGRFEDLRAVFGLISSDARIQAMLIAFCFGGLLEALAGFGAPVAITGVMLMAIGFSALRAATVVLLANTAPVAFGAIAIPIITAGNLTKIPYHEIGAYVGHQTPIIAAFVPLFLVYLADGRRGVRQTWPVALATGVTFGVAQWISATFVSVELTDIIASLAGLAAAVVVLRFWQPAGGADALAALHAERDHERASLSEAQRAALPEAPPERGTRLTGSRIAMALFPYLLVIVVFSLSKLVTPIKDWLTSTDVKIPWPGLDGQVLTVSGKVSTSTVYTFQWLSSPGTMLLICAVIVAVVYRVTPVQFVGEITGTAKKLKFSMLTIASVLALAYVMNLSGQTITIGTWIAGTGAAFAFFSPVLGWLGTAVTGSDTSANALFATLQQTAGQKAGIDPTLLVAANTSGGVVGKMVSPQNLTIAATAVGLLGRESEILRKVIWWSLGLLVVLCLLVGLQSTPVLSWMLP
ncbi:L-lactate permease [Arsenicicoccus piscis]|uniref:L-lactate permease n=1 Tax=Arsenicicoccus piscis TaxID=673954 RepID=A0ABQ6HM63_9MICO|nr:L-lactate permease [Arsenicicoccus piscis]MCH8627260.1 L-lactate permease [Arsenicicoccus piscis]GMA18758.1 L-lactate permease [Arsenicicoccus piscis]